MTKKRVLVGLVAILVILQFFQIDKSPIPIDSEKTFATQMNPPADVLAQLKSSCYDCHSNETKYPWYTYVAPISLWIKGHIKNARGAINFSTWTDMSEKDQKHALHECAEEIEEGHMPPKGYVRMHRIAAMDEAKKSLLIEWFEANE
jgi:hypothetical protein